MASNKCGSCKYFRPHAVGPQNPTGDAGRCVYPSIVDWSRTLGFAMDGRDGVKSGSCGGYMFVDYPSATDAFQGWIHTYPDIPVEKAKWFLYGVLQRIPEGVRADIRHVVEWAYNDYRYSLLLAAAKSQEGPKPRRRSNRKDPP